MIKQGFKCDRCKKWAAGRTWLTIRYSMGKKIYEAEAELCHGCARKTWLEAAPEVDMDARTTVRSP